MISIGLVLTGFVYVLNSIDDPLDPSMSTALKFGKFRWNSDLSTRSSSSPCPRSLGKRHQFLHIFVMRTSGTSLFNPNYPAVACVRCNHWWQLRETRVSNPSLAIRIMKRGQDLVDLARCVGSSNR